MVDANTVAIYDAQAGLWAERRGEAPDDRARRFRSLVGHGLIIDIGCGTGRYLAQLGAPVIGLDAARGMLGMATRSGAPLVVADLERLPVPSGSVAGAFARHSYLHLPKDRLPGALAEAFRVLRPGGRILVSMIRGTYEGRCLPGDDFPGRWFSFWEEPELVEAVRASGFSGVVVEAAMTAEEARDVVVHASKP